MNFTTSVNLFFGIMFVYIPNEIDFKPFVIDYLLLTYSSATGFYRLLKWTKFLY